MLSRKVFGKPTSGPTNKRLKSTSETLDSSSKINENIYPKAHSKYFPKNDNSNKPEVISEKFIELQRELIQNLKSLNLISGKVKYMYNPLEYASEPNENFIKKYCTTTKQVLFVGMNPGPNGMCQTGVPFGDPKWVRDWLEITGKVSKPVIECPERNINGLLSKKTEPSGDRLWSFFSKECVSPETFFKHCFICNFCPVAFMEASGRNVTPEDIKDLKV